MWEGDAGDVGKEKSIEGDKIVEEKEERNDEEGFEDEG